MSTFRVDLVAAVVSLLETYQAANPTLLRNVLKRRPAGVGETPVAWVGARNETETHSAQVHRRTFLVEVGVMDQVVDDDAAILRLDTLIDALVTLFDDNPRAITDCLIEGVSVTDQDFTEYTVPYTGSVISVRGIAQRGRD